MGHEDNGKEAEGGATREGTTVSLRPFKDVFLGSTNGIGFKFPIIAGSDQDGGSWFGSYSMLSDGIRKFEGSRFACSREVLTLQSAGGIPVISISTKYFRPEDGGIYRIVFNTGLSYQPLSQYPLPNLAKVGASGILGIFSGSDSSTVTVTWRVSPAERGASLLEILYSVLGDMENASEVNRFLLDAGGTPTSVSLSATTMGTTVSLSGRRREKGLLDDD